MLVEVGEGVGEEDAGLWRVIGFREKMSEGSAHIPEKTCTAGRYYGDAVQKVRSRWCVENVRSKFECLWLGVLDVRVREQSPQRPY
jgi:hypothetical protein